MGRKNRKRKRSSSQRRATSVARNASVARRSGPRWGWILGIALVAAILALGAGVALALRPTSAPAHHVFSLAPIIDGIPCDNETPNYHEHSHLDILNRGKAITVPENTGIHGDTCLYWMHTHDDSGEIHLEAPHLINFTLGKFFDIWHRPLSRRRVASAAVGPGTIMKVWVNFKPYTGDPRAIKLRRHTLVTIEVGPPFKAPQGFDWQGD